jgi:U2-associated protein SR140
MSTGSESDARRDLLTMLTRFDRIVFRSDVTDKLRSVLNGAAARPAPAKSNDTSNKQTSESVTQAEQSLNSSRFKKASAGGFKSTFVSSTENSTSAPALISDQTAPVGDDEDLDGEAMDQDLDSEAMGEDLDGEAMDADEDLDGEAM